MSEWIFLSFQFSVIFFYIGSFKKNEHERLQSIHSLSDTAYSFLGSPGGIGADPS